MNLFTLVYRIIFDGSGMDMRSLHVNVIYESQAHRGRLHQDTEHSRASNRGGNKTSQSLFTITSN